MRAPAAASSAPAAAGSRRAVEAKPIVLELGVKHFISHPSRLVEPLTKYMLYIQLREVNLASRLPCHPTRLDDEQFSFNQRDR